LEHAQADRIERLNEQRASVMRDFGDGRDVLQAAEEIGVLQQNTGSVAIDSGRDISRLNRAARSWSGDKLGADAGKIGFEDLAIVWMNAFGDNGLVGSPGDAHGQ